MFEIQHSGLQPSIYTITESIYHTSVFHTKSKKPFQCVDVHACWLTKNFGKWQEMWANQEILIGNLVIEQSYPPLSQQHTWLQIWCSISSCMQNKGPRSAVLFHHADRLRTDSTNISTPSLLGLLSPSLTYPGDKDAKHDKQLTTTAQKSHLLMVIVNKLISNHTTFNSVKISSTDAPLHSIVTLSSSVPWHLPRVVPLHPESDCVYQVKKKKRKGKKRKEKWKKTRDTENSALQSYVYYYSYSFLTQLFWLMAQLTTDEMQKVELPCVCLCVCVCVCVYMCMSACESAGECVWLCMHVHLCLCMHVEMHGHVYTCVFTRKY